MVFRTIFRPGSELQAAVRKLPDDRQRACALSGLGGDLWEVNPEESLSLLWESLSLARHLELEPIGPGLDDGPGYHGWRYPVTTADEGIQPVSETAAANLAKCVEAIWTLAHTIDNGDDRDAVIESLGRLLVAHKDIAGANRQAWLILNPLRRARLFAATANSSL